MNSRLFIRSARRREPAAWTSPKVIDEDEGRLIRCAGSQLKLDGEARRVASVVAEMVRQKSDKTPGRRARNPIRRRIATSPTVRSRALADQRRLHPSVGTHRPLTTG